MKYKDVEVGAAYEHRNWSNARRAVVIEKGIKLHRRSFPGIRVAIDGIGQKDVEARTLKRPWAEYEAEKNAERAEFRAEQEAMSTLREVSYELEVQLRDSGLEFRFYPYGIGKVEITTRDPDAVRWLSERLP